ncbi:MAG: translation initiation inhibitor [Verrucomicrobia bacterium]|nr:translation initiation inhibitor [Verrucomicrobiota bacterium]
MSLRPIDLETVGTGQASVESRDLPIGALPLACEFAVTERMRADEPVVEVFQRLADRLALRKAELLSLMVYGRLAAYEEIDRAMHEALGETDWPVTFIEGASCDDLPLAGVQAFAISGRSVSRIRLGNRIVASVYEDGGARHCLLGGLGPTAVLLRPPAQVQQMFGNLESALDLAGFELADVMRTWFFNDGILAWYDEFNRVRSAHYANVRFRTGSLPASTGIAGHNPAGAALAVAAWAVQSWDGNSCARESGSPLQCPAPAYASSFSRAMEIDSGGWRRLLVSGTASIHPDGKTAWIGNAQRQVDLTMKVVGAILQSRRMNFGDVTRATAYFENPLYKPFFDAWCAGHGVQGMPVVSVHCDICRRDLLFEIELDACVASATP